jgi:hypothetical protein
MSHPRPIIFGDEEVLCEALMQLREEGKTPMLSGMDNEGRSFAAFASPLDADIFCEVLFEHPYWPDPEWPGVRCEECGGLPRKFPIENLAYPVAVLTAGDLKAPEKGPREPIVNQPPDLKDIDDLLADEEKGKDK